MSAPTEQPVHVPRFDVTGRVAIVTGASSGLGRQFARVLHAAGAQVIAAARRKERLDELAEECPGLVPHALDVTDDVACRAMIDQVVAEHGRIDVLVNNAGLGTNDTALDEDLDNFRYVLEVNLVSVYNLARLAARPMIEAGQGSIINTASIFGLSSSYPLPNANYAASKAGVVNLTRDLAGQWGRHGVRVNAIAPGYFSSEMADPLFADEKGLQRVLRGTPMRRTGQEHELDGPLVFLASDASSFVTGHTLVVDGGWSTH
ncbi:MAG TPA: SDR family oxidoreductase [Nocardioides sp.]